MSTSNDLIAHTLKATGGLLTRFCDDLKPDDYLHRPCGGANQAGGAERYDNRLIIRRDHAEHDLIVWHGGLTAGQRVTLGIERD